MELQEFPKIARLSRECVISEKIDGTNAQIHIVACEPDDLDMMRIALAVRACEGVEPPLRLVMLAGSRSQYITPERDNHGFARWVRDHAEDLWALGEGRHFGEWWGSGIQRGYGLPKGEKRFSLFNTSIWTDETKPACCHVVPVLYRGQFTTEVVGTQIERLRTFGSEAAPGYMKPEGVIAYHIAANLYFKKTLERDDEHKSQTAQRETPVGALR